MRKLKKTICLMVAVLAMASTSVVAYAATTTFNITVGGSNPDVKSKRTLKSGTNYDNNFYVTATAINPPGGRIYAKSIKLDGTLDSERVFIEETNTTYSAAYNGNAPYDEYYYMEGSMEGPGAGMVKVSGRYTP